jgi:hypothetical protein
MRRFVLISISLMLVALAIFGPANAPAQSQRSDASVQIQKYLGEMKAITATPWSINEHFDLVGRPDAQATVWYGIAENMTKAVLATNPAAIDEQIVDDLVNQACDPLGWENPTIDMALAHVGPRAIVKLIDVIEAAPNRRYAEYYSRGLADILEQTNPADVDATLIDKVATGLDHPDRATSLQFAEALGAIGPPARRFLPALEKMFQRELEEYKKSPLILGIWPHDVVRWQIEKITGMPYTPDR